MVEVRRENTEAFSELDLRLKELQGWEGITGWPEDDKYPSGIQVADVAEFQEFGRGKIPPRPFMRPSIAKNQQRWIDFAQINATQILEGKQTGQGAMQSLADLAAIDVKLSIEDVKSPPLSLITLWARYYRRVLKRPVTGKTIGEIAAKIKSGELKGLPDTDGKPLVDTEQMMLTITGAARKT